MSRFDILVESLRKYDLEDHIMPLTMLRGYDVDYMRVDEDGTNQATGLANILQKKAMLIDDFEHALLLEDALIASCSAIQSIDVYYSKKHKSYLVATELNKNIAVVVLYIFFPTTCGSE